MVKQIIAVIATFAILAVAYYGSYLPYKKSQAFISVLRSLSSVNSITGLKAEFDKPLGMASPIGQEELVRNLGSTIITIMDSVKTDNDTVLVAELVSYLQGWFDPIMDRGRGMSFAQNLFVLGSINQSAFMRTGDPRYFAEAKRYYNEGLTRSPNRPQFLYAMFDVYRLEGDVESAFSVGERILRNWVTDGRVREVMAQLVEKRSAAPAQ